MSDVTVDNPTIITFADEKTKIVLSASGIASFYVFSLGFYIFFSYTTLAIYALLRKYTNIMFGPDHVIVVPVEHEPKNCC